MTAPTNSEKLRAEIVKSYDGLSPRLQQVAKYVLDNPNDMALQTLAVIADRCHVQPSTIVRFAKTFGYDGASQMQELFRDEMLDAAAEPQLRGTHPAVQPARRRQRLGRPARCDARVRGQQHSRARAPQGQRAQGRPGARHRADPRGDMPCTSSGCAARSRWLRTSPMRCATSTSALICWTASPACSRNRPAC